MKLCKECDGSKQDMLASGMACRTNHCAVYDLATLNPCMFYL
jgi:hypothetical protein